MQVDEDLHEHWACFGKQDINHSEISRLYRELKYIPHEFSETEISFFKAFRVNPLETCAGHTRR